MVFMLLLLILLEIQHIYRDVKEIRIVNINIILQLRIKAMRIQVCYLLNFGWV